MGRPRLVPMRKVTPQGDGDGETLLMRGTGFHRERQDRASGRGDDPSRVYTEDDDYERRGHGLDPIRQFLRRGGMFVFERWRENKLVSSSALERRASHATVIVRFAKRSWIQARSNLPDRRRSLRWQQIVKLRCARCSG